MGEIKKGLPQEIGEHIISSSVAEHEMVDERKEGYDPQTKTYIDAEGIKWAPAAYFTEKYNIDIATFGSSVRKDVTILKLNLKKGLPSKFYQLEQAEKILDEIWNLPMLNEAGEYTDPEGQIWSSTNALTEKFGISHTGLSPKLKDISTIPGRSRGGTRCTLYNVTELTPVLMEFLKLPRVEDSTGVYRDKQGEEWAATGYFISKFGVAQNFISDRKDRVLTIQGRNTSGQECALYNVKQTENIIETNRQLPKVDKATGYYTDPQGEKWAGANFFKNNHDIPNHFIKVVGKEKIRIIAGRTGDGVENSLYNVEDVFKANSEYEKLPRVNEQGLHTDTQGVEWGTIPYLIGKLKVNRPRLEERIAEQGIAPLPGRGRNGMPIDLYNTQQVTELFGEEVKLPKVGAKEIYTDGDGEQWVGPSYFTEKYGISHTYFDNKKRNLKTILGRYGTTKTTLYNLKETTQLVEDLQRLPQMDENGLYVDKDGTTWSSLDYLIKKLKIHGATILARVGHIPTLPGRNRANVESPLYNIKEVEKVMEEKASVAEANSEGVYRDSESVEWGSPTYFMNKYGLSQAIVRRLSENLPSIDGHHGTGYGKFFRLDQMQPRIEKFLQTPEVDSDTGIYKDALGVEWASIAYLRDELDLTYEFIKKNIEGKVAFIQGRNKNNKETPLYNITAAEMVLKEAPSRSEENRKKQELERVKNASEKDIKEISEGKTELAQHFHSLIRVFGSSHCLDILYKFRPEYKGLPPEYVKGLIGDYLGDFLVTKGSFSFGDVRIAAEFLSDTTFQEGLYETIKDSGLRYFFEQRRQGKGQDSHQVIYNYLDHLVQELGDLKSTPLDDIIQKVILYYDSVLRDFHKPEGFVDTLNTEREFPDINQRINMKELADKKRLLIADEMGLGKSASVIMAKEQMGVKCALVVAPSNVISTWQRYLSDNSEKGGYFQKGKAPRVIAIDSPEQAKSISLDSYDYILVSQERLNDRYIDALHEIPYDMMVVDEVHKMKKPEGVRSTNLGKLTEKISGEDKYLALLSGTPVPNKVKDIAVIIKMLYPDKFSDMSDQELVFNIIKGDIVDIRSLLLPRMQMKSLEEGVEMPELRESIETIELSPLEKEVYEVLVEDDELLAGQKMDILRKFLLNPKLVDATPGIEGAKIEAVREKVTEAFETHDKVVLFVNNIIEDVVRGEQAIVDQLHLPPEVDVVVVHGKNKFERNSIVNHFKTTTRKTLLVVSGQTADVGVDFTAGEKVLFYNEPWTEYDRRQQLARVYRPGHEGDLESETLIVKDTIEEGIHEYIQRKYKAVEKLLRGIPISELEQDLLRGDEKTEGPDLSVNSELAKYYFSSWDKMMKIFSYVKEIGETDFKKFLAEYAKDYAGSYLDLGNRSYQANANRVSGTIIHELAQESNLVAEKTRILDLASGPEMLKQHIGNEYQDRVFSIDINREHFIGRNGDKRVVGSINSLPFADESFEFASMSMSFHYTNFAPAQGKWERLQVLTEMNRVLKPEGKVVLNMMYSVEFKNFEKFKEVVSKLGFKVVEEHSGTARSGEAYTSQVITLEKVRSLDSNIAIEQLAQELTKAERDGLKFTKTDGRVKNSRRIVSGFELNGIDHKVMFNSEDELVRQEEKELLEQGEDLKKRFGKIEGIPASMIIENKFVRIRIGEKYVLFKKLEKGSGVVIVK